MLKFVITDTDNNRKNIEAVVSVVLNSETDVPADSLALTLAYDGSLTENADMIEAFSEQTVVFKGQIDEIVNIFDGDSALTKISARSLAGALLDNEAEPVTYIRPSADFIFSRHLEPFGISEYDADSVPYFGKFKIEKGMSQWQVFENFCKLRYGTVPALTGGGKALFKGRCREESVVFGFKDEEILYTALKDSRKRYKLISTVKLRLSDSGTYSSEIKNQNEECKCIKRMRYLNAASSANSIAAADSIISESNAESRRITLECPCCLTDILGCKAEINDKIYGNFSSMTVDKLKYSADKNGESTVVTLRKEI